jgi:hypothetical protein
MNLYDIIESAENKFLQILEDFFISNYDENFLPSHGINHHRRVWCYIKEIINILPEKKVPLSSQIIHKLIIASYLHDIGMSVDSGIGHGKHSRDLCIQFLTLNHLTASEYYDVLETIENHDKKDYSGTQGENELMAILSIADDLDALGYTGIYRYSEIYLKRGIDKVELGHLIIKNAQNRFDNIVKTFGSINELAQKHEKRFMILNNFFKQYNYQAKSYQFGGKIPTGYCGIIEFLLEVLNRKIVFDDILQNPDKYSNDNTILNFFSELAAELSS